LLYCFCIYISNRSPYVCVDIVGNGLGYTPLRDTRKQYLMDNKWIKYKILIGFCHLFVMSKLFVSVRFDYFTMSVHRMNEKRTRGRSEHKNNKATNKQTNKQTNEELISRLNI